MQQVSPEQVANHLARAQPLQIALIVACVMGSLVTRAARWQVFFLPKRRVSFQPLFGTLAISYMASTFLPLRAGELVRAVFLGQRERIPIPGIVGTILLEKLFDFLAIGVMILLLVLSGSLPPAGQVAGGAIAAVILVGFGFVVALAMWRSPTLQLVGLIEKHLPLQLGKRFHLQEAARHFAEGTDSLRVPQLWALLLGWTAVTWAFGFGSTWSGIEALDVHKGLAAVLAVLVLTNASQAIPSSPGYVGVYHLASKTALTFFGVDDSTAVGIALITWAFSYGSLVVVGLIALWTGGYTFDDILRGVRARGSVATAAASAEPL